MSLALTFDRLPSIEVEVLAPSRQGTSPGSVRSAVPINFRNIVRRLPMPEFVGKDVTPPADAEDKPTTEVALNLLGDVAKALPELMTRCRTLEETIAATKEQARADLEAATEVAREWQQIAQAMKVQVERLEKEMVTARARAEAAEEAKLGVLAEANRSQQAAAEAECLASLFKNRVIESFGVGTESYSILETIRSRTEEMLKA